MLIDEVNKNDNANMIGMTSAYYLLGIMSAFENRFQAMADAQMKEISWKQFYLIICISLCKEDPTLNQIADMVGSSHQNVKQILIKLVERGFVEIYADSEDKRKHRIRLTEHCKEFCTKNNYETDVIMEKMFAGITEEQIQTTIKTIEAIEKNMNGLE